MPSSISVSVSAPLPPQANVFSSASGLVWLKDKAAISTGAAPVTFQVTLAPDFTSNIYSAAVQVPANYRQVIYVGVGNKLTVVGGCTIEEIGTTSSATAGVNAIIT